MSPPSETIRKLETAIAAQESLRTALGDAVVDAAVDVLRARLDALRSESEATTYTPAARSPQELLSRLQSYIPRELADKMQATDRIEGERRQVTVLFADLSGFTSLGELMPLEDYTTLTSEALKELAEAVYEYEGYIDKFIGDSVMAVFGAPVEHEDDPDRALRAALSMRERMEQFNRHWADRFHQPVSIHIGINSGVAVAGNVGHDLRMSYTVMGDAVNTAARLEEAAAPGQILVSKPTYRLTQAAFHFEPVGPIRAKGKREPVPAFALVRARLYPQRARGFRELASSLVGREAELRRLDAVAQDLARGRGGIVFVSGDAGIGKSRLVAEWRQRMGAAAWGEGHCFQHTGSLAYGPFLDMLRRYAGISDDDGDTDARRKLDTAIGNLFANDASAQTVFAAMMALRPTKEETELLATLPAEVLRQRIGNLTISLLERLAKQRPQYLLFEDLHWADGTTLEMIEDMLALTTQVPLVVVATLRSQETENVARLRAAIGARYDERFTDLRLRPLSDASMVEMVGQLLSLPDIPPALRELVLEKAEGNPFFVEEVIRSLIDHGALHQDARGGWVATRLMDSLSVPDTVQGVLMARLDGLPEETKWVAQQASIIGRIFLYRVLRHIAERTDGIDDDLDVLQREDIIRERARHPEVEYLFKHALTQEVAYESLLAPRRQQLHRRVGEAMEALFPDRLGEFHTIIGEHYLRGEAWEQATSYLTRAGDASARLYAHSEARTHFTNAYAAALHLPDDEATRRRRVDLIIKRVSVSIVADEPKANLARLEEAEAMLATLTSPEDRVRLARVQFWMGRAHYYQNNAREALAYFQKVLPVAQAFGDEELIAFPASSIGRALTLQGQFARAEPLLLQAAPSFEKIGSWLEWIRTTGCAGICRVARGDVAAGVRLCNAAIAKAEETHNLTGIGTAFGYLALIHALGGDAESMLDAGRRALAAVEQSGDRVFSFTAHGLMGWAYARLGDFQRAQIHVQSRDEIMQALGGRLILVDLFAAADAETALLAGDAAGALALAEKALAITQQTGGIYAEALAHRVAAEAVRSLDGAGGDARRAHLLEARRLLILGDTQVELQRLPAPE